ncbi:DUF456 domain-containing protein [Lyngbya sp. CCY1209]|jgi:uncharacterized protein YqgC (DUF456 family)|uniref:DUF456 domain-containing protein n=1 Tax=Lyngbya sp. CCY1209 TaxID=2886103 RepID=UPI002D2109FF|nr:DUF456 domain-containing protein [Lyngbya sp. CCY1209]MEB3883301.1 DUF456 domain-containing protein [Lyngbya sp. CCY1209]
MLLILYWILVLVMVVGVVGAVVPGLPGSSLIVGAVLVWAFLAGFAGMGWPLGVAIAVLLLSVGVDFLSAYLGARQAGASRWGQIGAIVGLLLGFFGLLPALPFGGPLLGLLIGPLVGAWVGEFLYRRELPLGERIRLAAKAAIGIFVGTVLGNIFQGLLALAATVVFLITTWPY